MEKTGDSSDGVVNIGPCKIVDEIPSAYYVKTPSGEPIWIVKSDILRGTDISKIGDVGNLVLHKETVKMYGIK